MPTFSLLLEKEIWDAWRSVIRIRVRPRKPSTVCVTPSRPTKEEKFPQTKEETKKRSDALISSHLPFTIYILPWKFTALKLSLEGWFLNTLFKIRHMLQFLLNHQENKRVLSCCSTFWAIQELFICTSRNWDAQFQIHPLPLSSTNASQEHSSHTKFSVTVYIQRLTMDLGNCISETISPCRK